MATLTPSDARALVIRAFGAQGMPAHLAAPAAAALVQAEQEGLPSHGLARVPFYAAQMKTGKVRPQAEPVVTRDGAVVRVDAGFNLAFDAIAQGAKAAQQVARELGVAVVSITHSHHFGVAGQSVEVMANHGLIALALANAPASMAPWGGTVPLYGTNPVAFGCPRADGLPLVIDLSLSHVARGKIMLAQKSGTPIPEGWALDRAGQPTTDPDAAIAGTMVPSGGAKGAALALMVELLTAGLAGAHFGWQASSLFDDQGGPPDLAHFLLVLDPARFAPGFAARAEAMFAAIEAQPGARLPGSRRHAERASRAQAITIPDSLLAELAAMAQS